MSWDSGEVEVEVRDRFPLVDKEFIEHLNKKDTGQTAVSDGYNGYNVLFCLLREHRGALKCTFSWPLPPSGHAVNNNLFCTNSFNAGYKVLSKNAGFWWTVLCWLLVYYRQTGASKFWNLFSSCFGCLWPRNPKQQSDHDGWVQMLVCESELRDVQWCLAVAVGNWRSRWMPLLLLLALLALLANPSC